MNKTTRTALLCLGVMIFLGMAGCVSLSKPYPKQSIFTFTVPALEPGKPIAPDAKIRVLRFESSESYDGVEFVYRVGENEIETDFNNVFFKTPAELITDVVRETLTKAGHFRAALPASSALVVDYVIEGHIESIHLDLRDSETPKAVLIIYLSLVDARPDFPELQLHKRYAASIPLDLADYELATVAPAAAAGWDKALKQILEQFIGDMRALKIKAAK
jgi:ABC-type uncharacterized transport system auxiliary subunit